MTTRPNVAKMLQELPLGSMWRPKLIRFMFLEDLLENELKAKEKHEAMRAEAQGERYVLANELRAAGFDVSHT